MITSPNQVLHDEFSLRILKQQKQQNACMSLLGTPVVLVSSSHTRWHHWAAESLVASQSLGRTPYGMRKMFWLSLHIAVGLPRVACVVQLFICSGTFATCFAASFYKSRFYVHVSMNWCDNDSRFIPSCIQERWFKIGWVQTWNDHTRTCNVQVPPPTVMIYY